MAEGDPQRLQELVTALVRLRIGNSLAELETVMAAWRRGERDLLEAHAVALRHAARTNVLSARVARAAVDGPAVLLRDALDAGLLDGDEFHRLTGKHPEEVPLPPALDEDATRGPDGPEKRGVVDKLMGEGPVLVHLDPRRPGVDVPPGHRDGPRLVLRFGHGLKPPILDMIVDDHCVAGTLTFQGQPYRCIVPWSAVFAVVGEDGRGLVWSTDVPAEIVHEYRKGSPEKDGPDRPPDPESPTPKPKRGHLKLV